eukprot:9312135-Ditylum_brightwellii.AAC.1
MKIILKASWSRFANWDHWFDNWADGLVELGFAKNNPDIDEYGNVASEMLFLFGQKRRIINFDKSATSTDCADDNKGGCSIHHFFIKNMLCPGTPRFKSPGSSTFIGGTTAAGENIPCHMQFQSDAQNMEDATILYSWIDGLPIVSGCFGHEEVKISYQHVVQMKRVA